MKRFFVNAPLSMGMQVALPAPLQHRLRHVLRMAAGDEILLFNQHGTLVRAQMADTKAHAAVVREVLPEEAPLPPLVLAVAMLKRDAWETALRQATELGATRIIPLKTEFAQVGKINPGRAESIMAEAAEQSERTTLPVLENTATLADFLTTLNEPCLWAYERLEGEKQSPPAATVLVGPEGGFSLSEVQALKSHPHIHAFSLGSTILRADTAVVAALTVLKTRGC